MVFFHAIPFVENSLDVEIMFAMKFAILVHVGSVTCCQEGLKRAIVVKQAYMSNDRAVWILYRPVPRSVAKLSSVGCINVKRSAMLGSVHLVQFLSPKNAVADQLLKQWNATKQ